jgi:signal transduction histidine kinase
LKGTVKGDITSLLASVMGDVWIGTDLGEVWHLQSSVLAPVMQSKPLAEGYVSSMVLDPAGRLWAATRGAGLQCYDPVTGKSWSPPNALPSQSVSGLVFDTQSNLWLTTPKGILVARRIEIAEAMNANNNLNLQWVAHLDETSPGLPGGPTSLLSRDGLLWIVAGGSAMLLDPHTALVLHPPPPVYIESMRVNNGSWHSPPSPAPDVARIHPLVRALEFEFTSPCLTLPEQAQFRCKLEGLESDWVEVNSLSRRARYGAIPPGKYRFRVEACDADGTWNREGASLAFLVPIPVWRTSWAICAYVVALAGMVYSMARFVSHRRLRRRLLALEHSEEMSRERMRIAQDMHDEIGSKLARISYLSEGVKTELKGVYSNTRIVDSLAKTSRDLLRSLDQMVWAVNPHNDTVEQLAVYLCRYATDFFQDTSILCEFRVPENLPSAPLSAEVRHNVFLAFQETLTNILKHSAADHLLVELSTRDDRVHIAISDNGHGFDPAKVPAEDTRNARPGQGIPGLHRRLHSLGGECRIQSTPGQGTTVLFGIPFGNHRPAL